MELNVKEIGALADLIEIHVDIPFDMKYYDRCIAGFFYKFCPDAKIGDFSVYLGFDDVGEVIMPKRWQVPGEYTREQAVAMLRNLAITGKVEWK